MTTAQKAIKAATIRHNCGRFAANVWRAKHGVPTRLYVLACQLHAVSKGLDK